MIHAGKLIAFEGIDGSGKHTQLGLLSDALDRRGIAHLCIAFPRYESFFGRMVAQFLNGDFGRLASVDPHFSALLFAGDRLEAKPEIESHLAQGKLVLADRYVGSNLAHQGARVPQRRRDDFVAWLKQLEYGVYGLPAEDLVIYLRVPALHAHQRIGKKAARTYTRRRRDLLEANLAHLNQAARLYDLLAKQANWVTVECSLSETSRLRGPEAIHKRVLEAVESRLAISRAAG